MHATIPATSKSDQQDGVPVAQRNVRRSNGSVATLELRRSLAIVSAKLDYRRAEQTKNEAME